ncbi:hypothetical protein DEM27_01525 [Metarhizobium album]|uniref:Schlafen AlbA-2 domain-containing protein n=1 Tax=Metarhizobium album TaxID=2182425 RepID=A0A2U2DX61_9HYPH|nr:ATP-binding protein [Rhizobium album]PWE57900.1 hypothetical protein DEM27_01525 [Rhizobium album]
MSSVQDILSKPSDEWALEDLHALVELEAAESSYLELKENLQKPNGSKGWADIGKLHKDEARGLAEEIVAFANSSGGVVVVGIEESKDHPKRARSIASPLSAVVTLVERLRDSFSGSISPRIMGLKVTPILAHAEADEGYVVIHIPKSSAAPHGVGRPPACYWRRDAACQPMEMTDLQNIFWEARTSRERVSEEQNSSRKLFTNMQLPFDGFRYRLTAVSERALQMPTLAKDVVSLKLFPPRSSAPSIGIADYPLWVIEEWKMRSFGAQRERFRGVEGFRKFDIWRIDETGVVDVIGVHESAAPDSGVEIDPFDVSATAAHLIHILDYLNHYTDSSAGSWILDGEFKSDHPKTYVNNPINRHRPASINLMNGAAIRSMIVTLDEYAEQNFRSIEDKIWATFGMMCPDSSRNEFLSASVLSKRYI